MENALKMACSTGTRYLVQNGDLSRHTT